MDKRSRFQTLPKPKGSFLLGNTAAFGQDPLGFLTHCSQTYGEIVPLRFLFTSVCLLTRPEHIEQVLKEGPALTKNAPAWNALRTLVGAGLLTSEGELWTRQRRLMQPVFHQQRISAYGETMAAYTERLIDAWDHGDIRNIHQDMTHLTLNIVTKTLLNVDMSDQTAQTIAQTLEVAMQWFNQQRKIGFLPLPWLPTTINRQYRRALQQMDAQIYGLIQQRRSRQEDPGDLLSLLIQAQDEVDGSRMTDRQLRDELTTLVIAGHETTANSLTWTWMLLGQHPDVEAKLFAELESVLGGCSDSPQGLRPPTVEDIPQLLYAQSVIKEAMRLYPSTLSLARTTPQDYELGEYLIPAGWVMMFSPWVMHRSSRYFEDPQAFRPERWENDLEKRLPKGVYLPFGDGPRVCIGKSFALMEAILVLATIARRFQLSLVPDQSLEPLASMTIRPKHGVRVKVLSRKNTL